MCQLMGVGGLMGLCKLMGYSRLLDVCVSVNGI